MTEPTDVELMLALKGGDRNALGTLFERYERPLINFLYRMVGSPEEAEDLFQEAFVRVLRAAKKYEPRAAFSTWLYTIARNLCLDRIKKIKGLPTLPLDGAKDKEGSLKEVLPGTGVDPGDAAMTSEMATVVKGALFELPPKKREVLVLRVFQGLPYEEIARIVSAPLGTVKYRIHDAMKSLSTIVHDAVGKDG